MTDEQDWTLYVWVTAPDGAVRREPLDDSHIEEARRAGGLTFDPQVALATSWESRATVHGVGALTVKLDLPRVARWDRDLDRAALEVLMHW